jgi:hypothetical protein
MRIKRKNLKDLSKTELETVDLILQKRSIEERILNNIRKIIGE